MAPLELRVHRALSLLKPYSLNKTSDFYLGLDSPRFKETGRL
jgi:hypothetical protein